MIKGRHHFEGSRKGEVSVGKERCVEEIMVGAVCEYGSVKGEILWKLSFGLHPDVLLSYILVYRRTNLF